MSGASTTRGSGHLEGFLSRRRSELANAKIPDVSRTGRILDIGCGHYPYFLTHVDFAERHGLDRMAEEQAFEVAESAGIRLRSLDAESHDGLPYESDWFDVVTMLAVFEHIEPTSLPSLLGEIRRILKPGGLYIMTTPSRWTDKLLRLMARLNLVSREEIAEHKYAYTLQQVAERLTEAGFDRESMHLGRFEFFANLYAVARKPR